MRNRRSGGQEALIQGLKDYIVPIIGIILILFLIYSFFFAGNGKKSEEVENRIGINILFDSSNTKAKVYYPGGKNTEITNNSSLYKGDKIVVSSSRLKVRDNGKYSFNINERGELKYISDSNFLVSNGEIWLDSDVALNVDMTYAKVKISPDTHLSFNQNEVSSTVYLVSGMAEVSNNVGKSVALSAGEEIEILRKSALDKEIDLSVEKKSLDDYFKASSWFVLNKGASYSGTGKIEDGQELSSSGKVENTVRLVEDDLITFGNLQDESHVSGESIDVYGNFVGDNVSKIIVNNDNVATLNKENNTFNFDSVKVPDKVNDLVFKVYDSENNLINKVIYTIYYDGYKGTKIKKTANIKSTKFDVDGSQFTFTAPSSEETYTTYEDSVTIKGKVTEPNITRVTVNEYRLTSFNGSTWMYHARKDTLNLVDGTNRYEIKYYNGEKLVYTNYYTIVKKVGTTPSDATEKTEKD